MINLFSRQEDQALPERADFQFENDYVLFLSIISIRVNREV